MSVFWSCETGRRKKTNEERRRRGTTMLTTTTPSSSSSFFFQVVAWASFQLLFSFPNKEKNSQSSTVEVSLRPSWRRGKKTREIRGIREKMGGREKRERCRFFCFFSLSAGQERTKSEEKTRRFFVVFFFQTRRTSRQRPERFFLSIFFDLFVRDAHKRPRSFSIT